MALIQEAIQRGGELKARWYARLFREHRPHTRLDLLAPPLLAEVIVHVKPNGERLVYMSKAEASPQELVLIVQSVVEAGMDLAKQHNVKIEFKQAGG